MDHVDCRTSDVVGAQSEVFDGSVCVIALSREDYSFAGWTMKGSLTMIAFQSVSRHVSMLPMIVG